MSLFSLVFTRIRKAFTKLPTAYDYLEVLILSLIFGAIAIPFGLLTGFLEITGPRDSIEMLLAYTAVALVFPGIAEELVFRVILIPHREEKGPQERSEWNAATAKRQRVTLIWSTVALILFVIWHPVNAWLFLPWTRPLFYRLDFLIVAALLGISATVLYLRSGSIWPGVLFHWAVDVGWKIGFGGRVITFGDPYS